MKTVLEYLKELPEPYRNQAIVNTSTKQSELIVDSLLDALRLGFAWWDSPEGFGYWYETYLRIERGEKIESIFTTEIRKEWEGDYQVGFTIGNQTFYLTACEEFTLEESKNSAKLLEEQLRIALNKLTHSQ